jgi:hypothetical protein
MSVKCPACSHPGGGRFCSQCGGALKANCRECGADLPKGGRFCNQCGTSAEATEVASPAPSRMAWVVAAVAVVLAVGIALLPRFRDADVPTRSPLAPMSTESAASLDLASMSPREAADRLFNRVMQSVSSGDQAGVDAFLSMAITAYGQVGELDADAQYHLALLHRVDGNPSAVSAAASAILETRPTHLFGLFTLAELERDSGNPERARELAARFLAAYESERAAGLPEYAEHARALDAMLDEARQLAR